MEEAESALVTATGADERLALIRTVTELNNDFHRLIQQASRNSRLQRVVRMVVDVPLVFRSFYWYTESELTEAAREHEEIIQALIDRDGDRSEALMRRHINRGLNTLRREITGVRG
jgi:DNA-binding GntR family transcriptional regulator